MIRYDEFWISMLTISLLVNFFIAPALGVELPLSVTGFYYPFMGFMAVTTILLFLLTGSKRLNAERLLDTGLIYMILIALAININNSLAQAQPEAAGGVSWTAVWILIYSAIVPSTPRRTAAALP